MSEGRRRLLRALFAEVAVSWTVAASAAPGRVKLASALSLRDEIAAAVRQRQPLVVLVSLEGCVFCRAARDHFLGPLRDEEGVLVVQVDMQSPQPLQDAQGRGSTHDQLVRAWNIRVAPTVLFLGPGGRELAPRLEGSSLPDFYGAYLNERMQVARAALRP
jgi:hypothetical protein